jgi:hypothetical protein
VQSWIIEYQSSQQSPLRFQAMTNLIRKSWFEAWGVDAVRVTVLDAGSAPL